MFAFPLASVQLWKSCYQPEWLLKEKFRTTKFHRLWRDNPRWPPRATVHRMENTQVIGLSHILIFIYLFCSVISPPCRSILLEIWRLDCCTSVLQPDMWLTGYHGVGHGCRPMGEPQPVGPPCHSKTQQSGCRHLMKEKPSGNTSQVQQGYLCYSKQNNNFGVPQVFTTDEMFLY